MEELFTLAAGLEWNPHRMDDRRIIKNMWELPKGSDSKYSQEFGRADAEIHESVWARIIGSQTVWRLVEAVAGSSNRKNSKRIIRSSN